MVPSLITLVLAATLTLGDPLTPTTTVTIRPATNALSTGGPQIITEATQAIGAFIRVNGKKVQLVDMLWGIDNDDDVSLARFKGVDEAGKVYDYDHPEAFKRIAYSTKELRGAYIRPTPTSRYKIEDISFTLTADGFLTLLTVAASSPTGEGISYFLQTGGQFCCQKVQNVQCLQGGCSGTGCNGTTFCQCSVTGQTCTLQTFFTCEGKCGHGCAGGANQVCTNTVTDPFTCGCSNP